MKDKIKNFIYRHGNTLKIGNKYYKALMRLSSTSEIKTYLDDIESMAVIKPAYIITFSYDEDISENATFTFGDRTWTVRKITPIFYETNIIYYCAVAY